MRWCTRATVHFDRTASAWLIVRFVDRDATFLFLSDGDPVPVVAEPFGMPGVALAAQDGETSTFERILGHFRLGEPALVAMGRIVGDGVRHVMRDPDRLALGARDPHLLGLLAVTEGLMLGSASDDDCLARSLPVFDALHARLTAQDVIAARAAGTPLRETSILVRAVAGLRASGLSFSPPAFDAAVAIEAGADRSIRR